jgi:hypothetical protein
MLGTLARQSASRLSLIAAAIGVVHHINNRR